MGESVYNLSVFSSSCPVPPLILRLVAGRIHVRLASVVLDYLFLLEYRVGRCVQPRQEVQQLHPPTNIALNFISWCRSLPLRFSLQTKTSH